MEIALPFFSALFGAAFQEVLYWHAIKARLNLKTYKRLMHSSAYWVVTVVITISSAVGAIIWFADSLEVLKLQDFTLFGAAFPVLFKLGVSTITTQQGVRLGEQEKVSVLASCLFRQGTINATQRWLFPVAVLVLVGIGKGAHVLREVGMAFHAPSTITRNVDEVPSITRNSDDVLPPSVLSH
jgi:hypothetical protein